MTNEDKLEILGEFKMKKSNPEIVHILRIEGKHDDLLAYLVALDELRPFKARLNDSELSNILPDDRPDEQITASQNVTCDMIVHGKENKKISSSEDLESMFDEMLRMIIEESSFDMVPVSYFYKALLYAWESLEIVLVPSPTLIEGWMKSRGYRKILQEGREVWMGFRLAPVVFKIYAEVKAKKEALQFNIQDIIH